MTPARALAVPGFRWLVEHNHCPCNWSFLPGGAHWGGPTWAQRLCWKVGLQLLDGTSARPDERPAGGHVARRGLTGSAAGSEAGRQEAGALPRDARAEIEYLDLEAEIGISKHMGGAAATTELLSLCQIESARDVLNVGRGIGVESAYIARTYGCRVVGIDISPKMLAWARQRAREAGIADQIELLAADVQRLPFADDSFDVVFAESVLTFVDDKAQAIRECVRVARPGGYVGLNEGFWLRQPSPRAALRIREAIGPLIPMAETWQALWEGAGLHDRVARYHRVRARQELRRRVQGIGWTWMLRAWGRALRLVARDPAAQRALRRMLGVPWDAFDDIGYGVFVGRK